MPVSKVQNWPLLWHRVWAMLSRSLPEQLGSHVGSLKKITTCSLCAQSHPQALYKVCAPLKVYTLSKLENEHPIHVNHLSPAPCYLPRLLLVAWCLASLFLFRCCQLLGVFTLLCFIAAIPGVTPRGKGSTGGSSCPVPAAFPPSSNPRHGFASTLPWQKSVLLLQLGKDVVTLELPRISFNSW